MVIDFNEYVEQRENERKLANAEIELVASRQALAQAYVDKGVSQLMTDRGLTISENDSKALVPLMYEAIEAGLSAAEIEALIIECIEEGLSEG